MIDKLISSCDFFSKSSKCNYLFGKIWKERTTMLLHGPREADKTSAAVDIALQIAESGRQIVYVDTCSCLLEHAESIKSAGNLFIMQPGYDDPADKRDYADLVISNIEDVVTSTDIRIFVVDSLTRIAALSFGRNASAAYVMKRLVALQMRYGVSLIVIAHDSTKSVDRALNTLADCVMEETLPQPSDSISYSTEFTKEDTSSPATTPPVNRRQRREFERQLARQRKRNKTSFKCQKL